MEELWHKLNLQLSNEERDVFNKWRVGIYESANQIVDQLVAMPDTERQAHINGMARKHVALICNIPFLGD